MDIQVEWVKRYREITGNEGANILAESALLNCLLP